MLRTRILIAALLATAIGATAVQAQRVKVPPRRKAVTVEAKTEEPRQTQKVENKPQEETFNPFGDASKFTRFGGWGGIGASVGQFGMARSMLVMLPAVQEELEITPEQKQALLDWQVQMRERGREMAEQMRAQGEQNMRQMNVAAALEMMGRMSTLLQENEKGFGGILTAPQRKRLDQISLQMEGVTALVRPDVAQAVKLTEEQLGEIQLIITQTRFRQIGYWLQQANTMRQTRDRERSKTKSDENADSQPKDAPAEEKENKQPDASKPRTPDADEPKATTDTDEDDDVTARKRAERRARVRKQFETMRSGADQIQDETVRAIMKVLAPRQRTAFDRLLGPPFDPSKAFTGISRPGQSRDSNSANNESNRREDQDP